MPFLYSQGSTDGRKKLPYKRRIQSENCQTDKFETDFQNDKIEERFFDRRFFFEEVELDKSCD